MEKSDGSTSATLVEDARIRMEKRVVGEANILRLARKNDPKGRTGKEKLEEIEKLEELELLKKNIGSVGMTTPATAVSSVAGGVGHHAKTACLK